MERRFIGKEDLAVYLDVSPETIRSWQKTGKVPYFKVGRLVKFDLKEIERWLQKKRVRSLSEI